MFVKTLLTVFSNFNEQLNTCFNEYKKDIYVLESHGDVVDNIYSKFSFHVVCRLYDKDTNNELLFENVSKLGKFVKSFFNSELIDSAVYRECLFRCIPFW